MDVKTSESTNQLHEPRAHCVLGFFCYAMKVMRIVLITSKLKFEDNGSPIGGSVVDLHLKTKGLLELGHDVSVVTAFKEVNYIPCQLPYRVFERRIWSRGLLGLQFGIHSILREFQDKADVFYIDGHMFLYGGGAYRMLGGKIPVIGFFNVRLNSWADASGNVARPPLRRRLKKKIRLFLERYIGAPIANYLDAFIFNTPHVQKLYHDFGIGKTKPNAVIEDFIATREIMSRFSITREGIWIHQRNASRFVVFSTGRMIPEKGFDLLLRAFSQVKDKDKYKIILSGDGPDKERLERLAREIGLSETIEFPGWVEKDQIYKFFKTAHVFIFPKWWIEYGSAVLTEAMAFGLPSIIPGGGALEWLTAGSALTFTNDSVEELAKRIDELGKNAKLRTELAEKALARAEELDYLKLSTQLEKVAVSVAPHS